jgi:transglutaminase-like putative cysteine protease
MTTLSARSTPISPRYSNQVYFRDGQLLTGVLASLLYFIVATSLDAAGYVQSMAILIPVTAGALALGFLMSYSRFDGFFALSHSMFTGLAWILYLMSGLVSAKEIEPFLNNGIPELQAKAYFVLLRWLNWVDAALNNRASADNYVFIFEISFLVWWLTYLGIWAIFRYGYTWRSIVPAGIVLLLNTYYAPKSILGFLVVFSLVALLLFVRTHLAEQQLRWREQRIYFNQDIALDFLRNGLIYSVIVLALAWLAPGLGRNLQVRTLLAPINDRWEQTAERWNQLYQGITRQTRPTAALFGKTLSLGGARNVGNSLVFQVDTAVGRYWRAVIYDTYTGRQWLNTAEEEQNYNANQTVPIAAWDLREPLTQTITLMAPTGNLLFGAPDIFRVNVPMATLVRALPTALSQATSNSEEPLSQAVEIAMARTRRRLELGESYTVVSHYTAVTERALEGIEPSYPPEILELYLQLPDNFSPRVAETARTVTAGNEIVYAKVKAIETFLRGYTYNEEIEAPAPDQDPVEYFLYEIKEGYCDYYATAMVLMLRSLGIPARIASGYAEGAYDEESFLYFITERDAHTWVEVYFPGFGWIEFEPTAGESALNRPRGDDLLNTDLFAEGLPDSGSFDSSQDLLGPDGIPGMEDFIADELAFAGEGGELGGRPWWVWTGLTLLVVAAGLWFLRYTQVIGPTQFTPELPPILYERLQYWASRLGLSPLFNHTPYEQAQRLVHALPEGRPFIQEITKGYVHFRFDRKPTATDNLAASMRSTQQAKKLIESWQLLRPLLWRAWLKHFIHKFMPRQQDPFALVRK